MLANCLIKSIDYGNGTDERNTSIANLETVVKAYIDIYTHYLPLLLPLIYSLPPSNIEVISISLFVPPLTPKDRC